MTTKIIFLDFDGVLNSQLYYKSGRHSARPIAFENDIDPDSVALLNQLVKATEAKVVVSSSWRHGRTVEQLQAILDHNGFVGEVIGKTKDLRCGEDGQYVMRGNEIYAWMRENKAIVGDSSPDAHNYIILDDDSDMLYWQRNNLFLVDSFCGLTPNLVYKATRFLNS